MNPIELNRFEHIAAVVPEYASGPGWHNRPLWVYIENSADGTYRRVCLQIEEQPSDIWQLFEIGDTVQRALLSAVKTVRST